MHCTNATTIWIEQLYSCLKHSQWYVESAYFLCLHKSHVVASLSHHIGCCCWQDVDIRNANIVEVELKDFFFFSFASNLIVFHCFFQGAFETSSKKKKKVPGSGNDVAATDGEWPENNNTAGGNNANNNSNDVRDKSRNRRGARDGRGVSDSRGWRGRESRENDRNATGGVGTNGEQRNGGPGGPPRRGPPGGRDGFRTGSGTGSFGAGGNRNARPGG